MRCEECGGEGRGLFNVEGYEGMVWVDCDECGGCGEVRDEDIDRAEYLYGEDR